ncbi:hypothetical protein ACHQM5_028458 [Ranunculus cassubicifolius]
MAALRTSLRHYRLLSTTITTPCTYPGRINAVIPKLHSQDQFYNNKHSWPTVNKLIISQEFPKLETYIESLKQDPKITDESYLSLLIQYYGAARMYIEALKLYTQMEQLGTPRTALSFNALLFAFINSKKYKFVAKLFDEIPQKYGFSPDKFSYHYLVEALCELGEIESVMLSLKEMEEKDMEVGTIPYCMVLNALYIMGKNERVDQVWKEMIEKGCSPDVVAYNVRIAHSKKGKPEDILALMEEMKTRGLEPDITSYNYLFTCYSKNGMLEEACKVYDDLGKNGCVPNGATYRSLIVQLCKTKDFEKAYEVFKESVQKNKTQSYDVLKKLADGLVKSSKRKEAKELIDTMKQILRDKASDDWNKLEVRLGLDTNEDDITEQAEVKDDECK